MSVQTLFAKTEQKNWCHSHDTTIHHKWSTRGYGNSRIFNGGREIAKSGGCGYDRRGAAIGKAITHLFPEQVLKLAKRECKGKRRNYKGSEAFYGLFYNAEKEHAWLDGACGQSSMEKVLHKIGFSLEWIGETEKSHTGDQFFKIVPLKDYHRTWLTH